MCLFHAFCMAFSLAAELPGWAAEMAARTLPLVRVYELPEFVVFSHAKHVTAKVECKTCHGNVSQQTVIVAQQPVKMNWVRGSPQDQ